MEKSFFFFLKIICILIAGMFLCVLLATIDNFYAEGSFLSSIPKFILILFVMLLFFIFGASFWGYENMGRYIIHNTIFYLLFSVVIIIVIIFIIKKIIKRI